MLKAKFVNIKVETAKLSSLKGKSGKGTGFVAKSIKYTNKYGEKRGFRFRYSTSKKMKAAKYKTTGLAKNTYTKTGLKKVRSIMYRFAITIMILQTRRYMEHIQKLNQ